MAWTSSADPRGSCAPMGLRAQLARWISNGRMPDHRYWAAQSLSAPVQGLAVAHTAGLTLTLIFTELLWPVALLAATSILLVLTLLKLRGPKAPNEDTRSERVAFNCLQDAALLAPKITPQDRPAPRFTDEPESWDSLMHRVSHELRTPLNAVIGFSDLMENETFGPLGSPRYQEYVRHIRKSGDALLKSAEDTLAMTSALSVNGERTVATSAQKLAPAIEAGVARILTIACMNRSDIEVNCPHDIDVLIEARALDQILLNILLEAVQHTNAPGRDKRSPRKIRLTASAEHDHVQIAVRASGFDPDRARDSLELCVARTLLELQGTSLLVIANVEHGFRAATVLDRAAQPDFFSSYDETDIKAPRQMAC